MIWSFPDHEAPSRRSLRYRNGVLAALTETLVVIQARYQSGSRNAAAWARSMKRPVWAVTAAPWMKEFSGSLAEIERGGARALCSVSQLFRDLDLPAPSGRGPRAVPSVPKAAPKTKARATEKQLSFDGWSEAEKSLFSKILDTPTHVDEIVDRTGLAAASAVTALLTLSLKDVVVEGPDGFFRRQSHR